MMILERPVSVAVSTGRTRQRPEERNGLDGGLSWS
jgi:hypothetical protein